MRRTVVALVGVMLMAGTASAQTTGGGYVEGFAGLARVNETNTGLFGGEVGFEVMDRLVVFGNVGYALNIFPDFERAALVIGCAPIECDAKARMTIFTGGARLMKLFDEDSDPAHRFYGGFGWRF